MSDVAAIEKLVQKQKELKQELAKAKDLQEINKKLREELKEIGASRADYAQLEALNKSLMEKVKARDLTFLELCDLLEPYKKIIAEENDECFRIKKGIKIPSRINNKKSACIQTTKRREA